MVVVVWRYFQVVYTLDCEKYEWNSSILVGHSDSNTTLLCPALDHGDMYGIALYCKETRWFWYGGGCGVGTFG